MLKDNIQTKSERTVWAEYRDGFKVKLRYVPREHLRRILKRCQKVDWDPRTHQKIESLDQQKWARLFAEEVFVDWEGLTPEVLRGLLDMSAYPTAPVPFSVEDCEALLFNTYDFDMWAQQMCADLAAFEAAEAAARKKSSSPTPHES